MDTRSFFEHFLKKCVFLPLEKLKTQKNFQIKWFPNPSFLKNPVSIPAWKVEIPEPFVEIEHVKQIEESGDPHHAKEQHHQRIEQLRVIDFI